MRTPKLWMALIVVAGLVGSAATAQVPKKGGGRRPTSGPSYRTLTGKIGEVKAGPKLITVQTSEPTRKGGAESPTWVLRVVRQTLLMRAGRNRQYAELELADLKAGDTVQAVAELEATEADRSHDALWIVVYPAGTTPPER